MMSSIKYQSKSSGRHFRMQFILGLLIISASIHPLQAQQPLTLSASIEAALKNNYSILISRNDAQIASNNNSLGNAGMLPTLDVSAGITKANVNTEQKYSNGNSVNQDGASTDGLAAGAHFNWMLFDGMKMFASRSRLGAMEDASGIELKMQIETTVATVMESYFRAVSLLQEIKVLDDAIAMFDERVKIAELKFQVGSGSKLDLLQSKTDRNARKSLRLNLMASYDKALSELNRLMGKNDFVAWQLTDSITINYNPVIEDLKKTVQTNNYELQFSLKQEEIYKNMVNESRSLRYPMLNLNIDYNYGRTENEVGFILLNKNQGLYSGLTLSWNLFNGRNNSREIQNAKLYYNTASLMLADKKLRIDQDLYVAFRKFQSELEMLQLEIENTAVATENVNVALESYRLGSISGIELKDAQNSYEDSQSRLLVAKLQAKLSEIALMKLNGELVK